MMCSYLHIFFVLVFKGLPPYVQDFAHDGARGRGVSPRGSGVPLSGTDNALSEMSFLMRGTMGHGGFVCRSPHPRHVDR